MKRRNADCSKLRRQLKRNKIAENMYGSTTVLYMKFLVLWAIVITADFMFMFRFEFLWPFWLLLRSVHDSFKYKGFAFSVLFIGIAITSDLVCLFFIPVHWLLFAASTYVWVQYVWHTDKGICLPTIILWMLFVYLEAGIRWKDSRHMPHLDLCRPFAAHCIGYPVVTLGFGFKSYVGYRIRQRRQREVAKENEFYFQIMQRALPAEEPIVTLHTQNVFNENETENVAMGTIPIATAMTKTTSMETITTTLTGIGPVTVTAPITTTISNPSHLCAQNVTTATTGTQLSTSTVSANSNILTMNNIHSNGSTNLMSNGSAILLTNSLMTANSQHNLSSYNNQQQQNHINQQNNGSSLNHLPNGFGCHNNNSSNCISTTSANHGITTTPTIATTLNSLTTTTTTATNTANAVLILTSSSSSLSKTAINDDKHYEALSSNSLNGDCVGGSNGGNSNNNCSSNNTASGGNGGAMANGHIGNNASHSKTQQKRNTEQKEHKNRNGSTSSSNSANETECKRNKNNNNNNLHMDNNCNGKEKSNAEQHNSTTTPIVKEKTVTDHQRDTTARKPNVNSNSKVNNSDNLKISQNELDTVVMEPVERTKGRRNRSKKDNVASKDNQQQQHLNSNNHNSITTATTTQTNHHISTTKENCISSTTLITTAKASNNNNRLHNSDASSVSSISSISTTSSSSLTSSATSALSNIASKVVSKICESCLKFETDIKKYRYEISHMKQIENELRQKLESNLTTKSCLQAKQKECDELEKRILELTNARHADFKASERRLTEERRQKQSLEAQLNNEKKARKLAEEKAARPECSQQCKQRKQQMEEELKQLRRDLKATEEAKLVAEQHGRKWEQESRMFEAEIRTRDTNQQPTEMLMNALAAMQDKNCTLEKNLSAETRVKLDLFSALGDAKRQLEISESRRRSKEDEVLDLKAKIAQLLAVMPTDNLCMSACGSTSAGSMLRMNETPPLTNVNGGGPGPASPLLTTNVIVTSAVRVVKQQQQQQQHQSPTSNVDYTQQQQTTPSDYCSGLVPVSVANSVLTLNGNNGVMSVVVGGASSLDPNATVYTPKTLQNCNGGVVVVGGGVVGNLTNSGDA